MAKHSNVLRSQYLTPSQHNTIQKLIGSNQCIALTAAQLYFTEHPHHDEWLKQGTGVLCLTKRTINTYMFQHFNIDDNSLIWETDIDNDNMWYTCNRPFFHMYQSQNCIVGFNFANEKEAALFHQAIKYHILKEIMVVEKRVVVKKSNKKKDKKRKTSQQMLEIGAPTNFKHVVHIGSNSGFNNAEDDAINEIFKRAGITAQQIEDPKTRAFMLNFVQQRRSRKKRAAPAPPQSVLQNNITATQVPSPHALQVPNPPARQVQTPSPPPSPSKHNVIPIAKPLYKAPKNLPPLPPTQNIQTPNVPPPLPPPKRNTPAIFLPNVSQAGKAEVYVGPHFPPHNPSPPPQPPICLPNVSNARNPEVYIPPPNLPFKPNTPQPPPICLPNISNAGNPEAYIPPPPALLRPNPPPPPPPISLRNASNADDGEVDSRSAFLESIRKGHQLKSVDTRDIKPIDQEEMIKDDIAAALSKAIIQRERAIQNRDSSSTDWDVDTDEWDEDD